MSREGKQRRQSFHPDSKDAARCRANRIWLPLRERQFIMNAGVEPSTALSTGTRPGGGTNSTLGSGAEKSTARIPTAGPPGALGRPSVVSAPPWPSVTASGAAVTGPRPQSVASSWSPTAPGPGCSARLDYPC